MPEPRWLADNTVFSWAQRIQLYNILCRLQGQSLKKKDISLKFLQGVQGKHESLAQAMVYQLDKLAMKDNTIPSDWKLDTMSITLISTVTSGLVVDMQLRSADDGAGPTSRNNLDPETLNGPLRDWTSSWGPTSRNNLEPETLNKPLRDRTLSWDLPLSFGKQLKAP